MSPTDRPVPPPVTAPTPTRPPPGPRRGAVSRGVPRRRPLPVRPPPGVTAWERPGRLPGWLSWPVVVAGPLVAVALVFALLFAPVPTLLPIPTFLVVVLAFWWFDRLEPEPWADRIHAMLWGATVAILVSFVVNTLVGVAFGEAVATVVSAPIVEEAAKAAGLLWIASRRRIDSVTDGLVFAGWIAAGFAAVENVGYFVEASAEGLLVGTFLLRGVLSPFAHPLFTIFAGITLARAIERGRSPWRGVLPGLLVAVVLHAAWNLAAVVGGGVAVVSLVAFVVLFAVACTVLVRQRGRLRRRTAELVPRLAELYGLTPPEVTTFASWSRTLQVRRSLPRAQRRSFDAVHAAVARIVGLHLGDVPPTAQRQQQALQELWAARSGRSRYEQPAGS